MNLTVCDQPNSLEAALRHAGNFRKVISGIPTAAKIRQEIHNGHVIALRVEWLTNRQGHFIVIYDIDTDDNVYVKDPWPTSNPKPMKIS